MISFPELMLRYPYGSTANIEHDGFEGKVVGWYIRDDGYPGLVLQYRGKKIVHVYGTKWVS